MGGREGEREVGREKGRERERERRRGKGRERERPIDRQRIIHFTIVKFLETDINPLHIDCSCPLNSLIPTTS